MGKNIRKLESKRNLGGNNKRSFLQLSRGEEDWKGLKVLGLNIEISRDIEGGKKKEFSILRVKELKKFASLYCWKISICFCYCFSDSCWYLLFGICSGCLLFCCIVLLLLLLILFFLFLYCQYQVHICISLAIGMKWSMIRVSVLPDCW